MTLSNKQEGEMLKIEVGLWEPDDTATRVLVRPMLEDARGLFSELKGLDKEACEKAYEYCLVVMATFNEDSTPPVSMGALSDYSTHFMNGYKSAKGGEVKLF